MVNPFPILPDIIQLFDKAHIQIVPGNYSAYIKVFANIERSPI